MTLPGRLSFAWESPTWGGGIAFFSPSPAGAVRATAYLVTARQFSDVFAQEMWREPGVDLDLAPVLAGGSHAVGPGRYETLHVAGTVDELPVLTFSCPDVAALGLRPPAAPYLATMVRGLRATHGLTDRRDRRLPPRRRRDHSPRHPRRQRIGRRWRDLAPESLTTLVTSLRPLIADPCVLAGRAVRSCGPTVRRFVRRRGASPCQTGAGRRRIVTVIAARA